MPRWKAGPERPKLPWCWECSRRLYGRVFAYVMGDDGYTHVVHKACAKGREVIAESTTVRL